MTIKKSLSTHLHDFTMCEDSSCRTLSSKIGSPFPNSCYGFYKLHLIRVKRKEKEETSFGPAGSTACGTGPLLASVL
jgi:hypothetical protein